MQKDTQSVYIQLKSCWFSPEPQLSLGQWVLPAYMVVSAPGKIITQCLLTDLIPGHRFFASSPVPRISYTYDWLLQLMIKPQKQNLCFMNFSFSSIFTSFEQYFLLPSNIRIQTVLVQKNWTYSSTQKLKSNSIYTIFFFRIDLSKERYEEFKYFLIPFLQITKNNKSWIRDF